MYCDILFTGDISYSLVAVDDLLSTLLRLGSEKQQQLSQLTYSIKINNLNKKMKILSIYLFVALFVAVARCSLLEMSQLLWSKLLEGGIAKIGALDPLRVPVVKIDQSEGNTTYRLVLRNVQVFGLNGSALESVRFARGKHMNNYSDSESGYVNYSDLRDVEAVQYRFHSPGNNKNSDGDHAAEGRDEYSAKYSAPQQYNNNNEQQQRQPSQYQDERYQRVQQAPDQYARYNLSTCLY